MLGGQGLNKKKVAMLASVAAVTMAVQAKDGHAIDFNIADGQTETTTQTLSGAGDSLTIEKGGRIMSAPTGVVINGADARVDNLGSISVSNASAYGLHSTASGTTFTNTGTLVTTDVCSYGVFAEADHFTLINNGTIRTTADNNSFGVYVEDANHATIVNNRTISTLGDTAYGMYTWGSNAKISNHGSLTTSGVDAIGIYAWHTFGVDSQNVLINTGTIRTTGTGESQGIYANARGMHVINSGTVSSKHAQAIYMKAEDQILTVLRGSVIEGDIKFGQAGSATLNLGRGLNARLALDGIPATINPNGQAYVIDDDEVLTVIGTETGNISATTTATLNSASSGAISRHLAGRRQGEPRTEFVPLGYAPEPKRPFFPEFAPSYEHGAWTSAFGSFAVPIENDSVRINQGGVLFGLDTLTDDGHVAGVFSGVGYGTAIEENGSKVDTTTVLGGGYRTFDFGAGFLEATATVGATFNKGSRQISGAGGLETASADYSGAFISPSMTIGIDHSYGDVRVTPSVSLLYAGIYQNGYTETGSSSNLTAESQFTNVVTARAELELGTLKLEERKDGWSGSVRLGAEGTLLDGNDVNGAVLGSTLTIEGESSSEARGFVGADFSFIQGRYEFSANTEVGYSSNGSLTVDIHGGIRVAF